MLLLVPGFTFDEPPYITSILNVPLVVKGGRVTERVPMSLDEIVMLWIVLPFSRM